MSQSKKIKIIKNKSVVIASEKALKDNEACQCCRAKLAILSEN